MVEGFPFPGKFLQMIGLFLPALYGFNDFKHSANQPRLENYLIQFSKNS